MTVLAPCSQLTINEFANATLKSILSGFAGSNPYTLVNRHNKNLAIADFARVRRLTDRGDYLRHLPVGNGYFNLILEENQLRTRPRGRFPYAPSAVRTHALPPPSFP